MNKNTQISIAVANSTDFTNTDSTSVHPDKLYNIKLNKSTTVSLVFFTKLTSNSTAKHNKYHFTESWVLLPNTMHKSCVAGLYKDYSTFLMPDKWPTYICSPSRFLPMFMWDFVTALVRSFPILSNNALHTLGKHLFWDGTKSHSCHMQVLQFCASAVLAY